MATYTAPLFGQKETDAARVCYSEQLTGQDVIYSGKYINVRSYPHIYTSKGSIVLRSVDIHLINKAFLTMPDFSNLTAKTVNNSKPPIYRVGTLTGLWWDMPDGRWHYIQLNHQLLPYNKDGNFADNKSAKPINPESEFYGLDNSFCLGFAREDTINHFFNFDTFRQSYVVLREPSIKAKIAATNMMINIGLIAGIGTGILTKKYKLAALAGGGMIAKKIYDKKKYTLDLQGARIQSVTFNQFNKTSYLNLQFKAVLTCIVNDTTTTISVNPIGWGKVLIDNVSIDTATSYLTEHFTNKVVLHQYEMVAINVLASIAVDNKQKTDWLNAIKSLKKGEPYPVIPFTWTFPYTVDGMNYTASFSGNINEIHRLHKGTFVPVNGLAINS